MKLLFVGGLVGVAEALRFVGDYWWTTAANTQRRDF
jgi:hypothetical protein